MCSTDVKIALSCNKNDFCKSSIARVTIWYLTYLVIIHVFGKHWLFGWTSHTGSAAGMLPEARDYLAMVYRDGQLHIADWERKGEVWQHLQSVQWRGEITNSPCRSKLKACDS